MYPALINWVSVPSISLSDHYPISFTRTTSKHSVKRQGHQTINYRCYKKFNEDDFLNELSNSLNTLFISQTDSNHTSNRKAMNRNWVNRKANPALKTKTGNK